MDLYFYQSQVWSDRVNIAGSQCTSQWRCGWATNPAIISTENYGFHAKLQKHRREENFYINKSGEHSTTLVTSESEASWKV